MFDDNSNPSNDFLANFSLEGVKAASGGRVLTPGRHRCFIKSVKLTDTKANNGSKLLVVLLTNDSGVITARLNIHNTNSAEATRIGREQARAMAEGAGVENPDHPFANGIDSMNGMEVGVIVGSERYEGQDRSQVNGFCKPEEVVANGAKPAPSGKIGDHDDIPF